MPEETKKRVVSPILRKILDIDEACTLKFNSWANNYLTLRSLRRHCKALELTCHGIPWLAFWITFTWLFDNPSLVQMQINILLGLILDIILVAIIKAYVRRRRPKGNVKDAFAEIGPDIFSFPSGHASRAVFVAYFFINLYPIHCIFAPPILAWAVTLCLGRILMGRHHILDVIAGVLLGLCEGVLLNVLWVSDETAKWLMNYLSDEKISGGEYHV